MNFTDDRCIVSDSAFDSCFDCSCCRNCNWDYVFFFEVGFSLQALFDVVVFETGILNTNRIVLCDEMQGVKLICLNLYHSCAGHPSPLVYHRILLVVVDSCSWQKVDLLEDLFVVMQMFVDCL